MGERVKVTVKRNKRLRKGEGVTGEEATGKHFRSETFMQVWLYIKGHIALFASGEIIAIYD